MKPLRLFRHVACEPAAYLGDFLEQRGIAYEVLCLDEGSAVPQQLDDVSGLVFMGGPGNVNEPSDWMAREIALIQRAAQAAVPILGICLGAQLISQALGGNNTPGATMEVGWHDVEHVAYPPAQDWFSDLPPRFEVFQWHAHTFSLPPGAQGLLRSNCAEHQAFAMGNILAMQFHLEMTPESITGLINRYGSDLEGAPPCVQSAENITTDLEQRTQRAYKIADVVYERWLQTIT